MNYGSIFEYFLDSDYDVQPAHYFGQDALSVSFEIEGTFCTLVHFCVDEVLNLPHFYLKNHASFGLLAHLLPSTQFEGFASICVNHLDSVSINFERPELVFEESIKRHVKLLTSLIFDPEFNQEELLREFQTNWYAATKSLMKISPKTLYCASSEGDFEALELYRPVSNDSVMSIPASYVALPRGETKSHVARFFSQERRHVHKNSIGYVIPLQSVETVIPSCSDELKLWLLNALEGVSSFVKSKINEQLLLPRSKEFWLLLNLPTPSGKAWFGMILSNSNKRTFPNTIVKMSSWKIEPIYIDIFNKELMMPRSGAKPSLDNKKILLFGCGSVGSELAHKLGSAGIGHIDIIDPDLFSTSNLYRHTLNRNHTHWPKAQAVSFQLQEKYPWLNARGYVSTLLNFRNHDTLEAYDLIVLAIGVPTHERLFHDYIVKSGVNVPVLYTWLEGYGIGGHAILDLPNKKGCLRCAYVEPNTGIRGLASNLNFIESDQDIVKNYAGCGEMFIPYGAISSTQTALIAADLAVNYLDGRFTESTKCSWKGDNSDSKAEGLKLTPRYNMFESSLKRQLLRHPLCDVCNSDVPIVYQCDKLRICMPQSIYEQLLTYRQLKSESPESAGLIIGYYRNNGEVWIDRLTLPKETDKRSRFSFKLDDQAHQSEVDDVYRSSDQILGYIGTWHTHPQEKPIPSGVDRLDWKDHEKDNPERPLFFVVVGLEKVSVFSFRQDKIIELSALTKIDEK